MEWLPDPNVSRGGECQCSDRGKEGAYGVFSNGVEPHGVGVVGRCTREEPQKPERGDYSMLTGRDCSGLVCMTQHHEGKGDCVPALRTGKQS